MIRTETLLEEKRVNVSMCLFDWKGSSCYELVLDLKQKRKEVFILVYSSRSLIRRKEILTFARDIFQ